MSDVDEYIIRMQEKESKDISLSGYLRSDYDKTVMNTGQSEIRDFLMQAYTGLMSQVRH